MCSSSLIYLLDLEEVMEEVMGGQVNCQLPSGLSPGSEGKWWGASQLASSLNLPQGASIPALQILFHLSAATGS
jgi:hypothetical protein